MWELDGEIGKMGEEGERNVGEVGKLRGRGDGEVEVEKTGEMGRMGELYGRNVGGEEDVRDMGDMGRHGGEMVVIWDIRGGGGYGVIGRRMTDGGNRIGKRDGDGVDMDVRYIEMTGLGGG